MLEQQLATVARQSIVLEAWRWLGTPYHHHGRVLGVGVDCANLLVAVYHACGLVDDLALGNYSAQWHLHRSEEKFLGWIDKVGAHEVTAPKAGDIGVWRYGRAFSHGGIVIAPGVDPRVLHAYIGRGVIASRCSEEPLAGRTVRWFSVFEQPTAAEA